MRRGALAILLLAAPLATFPTGCAGGPDAPLPPPPIDSALLDPATPAVLGATNGLEMRVWVIEDQDDVLAEAIDRFESRPTPMLDSVRTAWRASGLRVIEVPTAELAGLRSRLRLVAPEQRDWFGQSPDWSEAIRGRLVQGGDALRLADGVMKAPAGRLRVLMRCWTIPGEDLLKPALHLDLAVQLERRQAVEPVLELPAMASELEAGVVFPRLRATMRLPGDTALLIVPLPESVGEPESEPEAVAGPPAPRVPTLGEAMLSSAGTDANRPVRRRAVVALLPRLPDRFSLRSAQADANP